MQWYLLLKRDPKIIRLSSMLLMISAVLSPLSSSSPRFLKLANVKVLLSHSAITSFSFCSISLSFTALIQISCRKDTISDSTKQKKEYILLVLTIQTYLNFLFILEQRCFHDIAQFECFSFHLKSMSSHLDTKPNELDQFNSDTAPTDIIKLW